MENCEESNENPFIIPDYKDANTYCVAAFRSIVASTKISNELSSGSDWDYYSTFKGFQKVMLNKGQSILSLMTSLIQRQNVRERFQERQLEEKFDLLEEVNEVILENINNYIDEACGRKKPEDASVVLSVKPHYNISTGWNKKQVREMPDVLLKSKNVSRPQLSFKDKIDNSDAPFMPIITDKPNSIKPLAITLEKDNHKEGFCHPYEIEIEKFNVSDDVLEEVDPIPPRPLDETPLVYVNTEEQLKNLCKKLQQQKEFAVDLEHHSYRSFQGFTCLIQISTRDTDYIIDAIDLRSELHLLNQSFTDPKIVKILHGSDMDVVWLQRDFGVYIVNLFDTGQASRMLHFPHFSLSYLLKHFCKLEVDKYLQLADWRVRPIPSPMIKYARQDTHYLLYIYDCLKNDLIKNGNETKNLLRSTFERSRLLCLKKYEKPVFSEDRYLELYRKTKKVLNVRQLYCLKELFSWRDRIARENDESIGFVLPNHMLLQIAETLPREQQGVLACCNPIPLLLKQQLSEVHGIILNATRSSLTQLAALDLQQKTQSIKVNKHIDFSNLTRCPHDLLHVDEKKIQSSSSNLSTSLPFITKDSPITISSKSPSLIALFESHTKINKASSLNKVADCLSKLYSPFQRYEMTERLQMNHESPKSTAEQKSAKTKDTSETSNKTEQEVCDDYMDDDVIPEDQNTPADLGMPSTSSENFSSTPLREKTSNRTEQEVCDDYMDDDVIPEDQNTTAARGMPNASSENFSSTPLRKKSKKKKRKARPDVSLNCTPIMQAPPPKKSKTPEIEVIEEIESKFVPYDYSKTDLSSFSGNKKSKNVFNPGTEHNFKTPGKHHGRNKKNFKQGTFGNKIKQEKKNWPQNK